MIAELERLAELWDGLIAVAYNEYSHGQRAAYEHCAAQLRDRLAAIRSEGVTEAMEAAAEEIERGHEWITAVGASAIIRKHAAALTDTDKGETA